MSSLAQSLWLTARPKTLTASVVPVLVGTMLVFPHGNKLSLWIPMCAVLSAIFIQIGTNFINDALDFIKGADGANRLGEARATAQGWFTGETVLALGLLSFTFALLLGLPLVMSGGWPILVIGAISLLMGYAYTGGPFPLAYLGLGDLFVIIFFGVVAVGGVFYLETGVYSWTALVAGLQIGLLATVLIAINNLRDLEQDRQVNKKTLAVRLGPKLGRIEVLLLVSVAYLLGFYWLWQGLWFAFALPLLALPLAIKVIRTLLVTEAGRHYNQLLAKAALVHLLFGVLLSLGLFLK